MKGRLILLGQIAGRDAAALLVDGQLDDLLIDPPDSAPPAPGTIFRAVADRPIKGQGGMMMKLPEGQTALLRQAKGLAPGTAKLVQVTSYAEPGKAVPVTDRLVFKGRTAIVTPGAAGLNISRQIKDEEERLRLRAAAETPMTEDLPHGVIVRSNAQDADADEIAEEVDALLTLAETVLSDSDKEPECLVDAAGAHEMAWREWSGQGETVEEGSDAFENHGVLDGLDALRGPAVPLNPGTMYIEATRALIAVDVNTGGDFSPAAGLKANIAAARALPRALRLRGLGGQITLDLAPLPKKDRHGFETAVRTAFRNDPIETALVGWTPLGHFELQRKRERLPLSELLP